MDGAFFKAVRAKPFGGQLSQAAVDGLNALNDAWAKHGDGDRNKHAYILGTAFHESDRFRASEEYASGAAYEGRTDLGNTQPGDGKRFKGRGFVQVTGRRNYADWSDRLGIDLVTKPELAARRDIAARICVEGMMRGTFTGKKLADYIGNGKRDFVNARRTVNGTDKAKLIAGHALNFLEALEAENMPVSRSTIANAAARAIETVVKDAINDPNNPLTTTGGSAAATIAAAAVTAKVEQKIAADPAVQHITNTEPWYQSRVTIGALISIIVPLLGLVGVQADLIDTETATSLAVALGTAVGGALTLYGRWKARKPIGA